MSAIIASFIMFLLKKLGDFLFKKESMGGGDIKLLAIHGLVLGLLMKYNVFNLNMNLTIKVFFISLIVFIISLITSFILSKIPFIKRLIYVK